MMLLLTNGFSKDCYKLKHKRVCYKQYFDYASLYRPQLNTKYYKNLEGKIYYFENNIEIRFKRSGAILTIEDDYEIKFIDKKKKETYLYKLDNPNELFSIITNLNETTYITKAVPIKHRQLTILEHEALMEAKKASMQRRLDGYKSPKELIQEKALKERERVKALQRKKKKETSHLKKGVESDLMW